MRALLQTVSDAYVDATTTYADPSGGIDVDRAREQHAGAGVQAHARFPLSLSLSHTLLTSTSISHAPSYTHCTGAGN